MITLLDIQRMSSEDGPGLRTTAFFKGCSLACAWCHNPESIALNTEVLWHKARCMGCFSCVDECPQKGLEAAKAGIQRAADACRGAQCLHCVQVCPAGAMEAKGTEITPEELVKELVKDRAYWGEQGGVTLSGGEALLQTESIAVARLLKEQGIQVALDTCGHVSTTRLREMLAYVDLVLYDLKLGNSEQHKRWTGSGNELVLKNLEEVVRWGQGKAEPQVQPKPQSQTQLQTQSQTQTQPQPQPQPSARSLWIRTPLIPGATDSAENIKQLAHLIGEVAGDTGVIDRWELCAFNNLCQSKYESAQKTWLFADAPLITQEQAEKLKSLATVSKVKDIRITGATS